MGLQTLITGCHWCYPCMWCRQQNTVGWAVFDWVPVRLHNLHGLLHCRSSTACWLLWRQSTRTAWH